ncbi:MAG: FHA domain-containing protein [Planctomycetota bacterium]|nr:MAG: FHA domain-containing protein [Planctomycetota bacterium]
MEIVVEHIGGPRRGQIERFPAGRITVGRMSPAQVVIDDPAVDAMHLEITAGPNGIIVTDLGSSTGSFVAGQPLQGPTPLPPGAVVELGRGVALRIALEGAGMGPAAAPPRPPGAGRTIIAPAPGAALSPAGPAPGGYPPPPSYPAPPPPPPGVPPAAAGTPTGPGNTVLLGAAAGGAVAAGAGAAAAMPPGASPAPAVGPVPPPQPGAASPPPAPAAPSSPPAENENLTTFVLWVVLASALALGLLALVLLVLL